MDLRKGNAFFLMACLTAIVSAVLGGCTGQRSAPSELHLEPETSLIARSYDYWYQIEDGTLMRWGVNESYEDRQPVFQKAAAVWGAQYGAAVLDQDGGLWVWGTPNIITEVDYESTEWTYLLPDVVSVRFGLWHGMALQSDGTLWTWGHNDRGQLGNGTQNQGPDNEAPQKILEDIRSIASWGLDESAAVTWNNALLTWGDWDGCAGLERETQPVCVSDQMGGLPADQIVDCQMIPGYSYQLLDGEGNIYLVPLDDPDTSTLAVSSDAAALFNGGYRAKDGALFLWEENGGVWTANSMGDQVQQALPTVDGTLLLMEDGTLELASASMMKRWSFS